MDLVALFKDFGPWVALVAFLVWRDWKREERMAKRLDMQWEELAKLQRRGTDAIRALTDALRVRPCLAVDGDFPPTAATQPDSDSHRAAVHANGHGRTPRPEPGTATIGGRGRADAFGLGLLAVGALLLLAGCGGTWAQRVADTRAGAQAYLSTTDAQARAALGEAIARNVLAITADLPGLPSPTMDPAAIVADPAAYAADADPDPVAYDPPAPPEPGFADRLRDLGVRLLEWGGPVFAIGAIVCLLGWAVRLGVPLGWLGSVIGWPLVSSLARVAASTGTASLILGGALEWLADYLWAVGLAVGVAAAVLVVMHWRDAEAVLVRLWARVHVRAAQRIAGEG